jgi:hypothetical protein
MRSWETSTQLIDKVGVLTDKGGPIIRHEKTTYDQLLPALGASLTTQADL